MWRLKSLDSVVPFRFHSSASLRTQQRGLLWLGLGGLLLLLVALGSSAVSFLKTIEDRHEQIRTEFLNRTQLLVHLRNDVYRSGTRAHDFLLAENEQTAAMSRQEIVESQQRIEALEHEYARSLRPEEVTLFTSLQREIAVYFAAVSPILTWSPSERQRRVDVFVRDELHPRRSVMLHIADEIEALNGQDMERNAAETQSLFLRYRRLLVALVGVTLAIGFVLAGFSVVRIDGLERESDSRFRQVQSAKVELQALSMKLVEAQETERRKLSRELHDDIGQGLWAMVLGLGNAMSALEHGNVLNVREELSAMRRIADGMVSVVRNLALVLRPSILDDLGLIPAVKWLGRELGRASELQVDVSATRVPDDLRDDYRTCIYRVVQEALRNCHRHASASKAVVEIERHGEALRVVVADNGSGFRPAEERGLGVLGMEERVTHLGGKLWMRSEPGQGTTVEVLLPMPSPS